MKTLVECRVAEGLTGSTFHCYAAEAAARSGSQSPPRPSPDYETGQTWQIYRLLSWFVTDKGHLFFFMEFGDGGVGVFQAAALRPFRRSAENCYGIRQQNCLSLRPVANHFHRTGWPPRCSLKHTATAAKCVRY